MTRYIRLILILMVFGKNFTGYSQVLPLKEFEHSIHSISKDSLAILFNQRINGLIFQKQPDSMVINTLNLQLSIADSTKNKLLRKNAIGELINYSHLLDKRIYFDYLIEWGNHQNKLGNFDVGIDHHHQAIKVAEELNNDTLKGKVYLRLGINFMKADNIPLSQKYLVSAIHISENLNDNKGLSGAYMSYGNSFKNSGVYDSALFYYDKSLNIAIENDIARNQAGNYNNIGNVYRLQKKYKQAIGFYEKAVDINIETDNKQWLSYNYNNIGLTYKILKNYRKALEYYLESLEIKHQLGDFSSKVSTYENISEIYYLQKRYKKAYESLEEAERLKDEYSNENKLNLTTMLEAKFQNEKKESELKQLKAEQKLQEITIETQKKQLGLQEQIRAERKKLMIIMVIIIISLIFAIGLFWRNNNQRKKYVRTLHQKNNQIRTVQNDLQKAQLVLTKKNDEITDSINYAKRIQAAILPSQNLLKATLKNAFVLYLPKDIVAGDFYWTEQIGDTLLFAVADCTGHGVPGAMVSMICNSALSTSIKNDGLTKPGEILDNATEIVLNQFSKSEEEVKDGMDIALCAFNRKKNTLEYAGANIPLWLVRNGNVEEIKATRQPVGKYAIRQPFKTHEIAIKNDDIIYLSSDGFADQFGGERNKKYMKKNFKELLVNVSEKSIIQQNELINTVFIDWKAENEQVDDICVMGIKFTI